ncbi:MAG: uracil-DNA glycosylase family protein [Coriobacteriia bacterium]|nr:uracil-DNA glycosylase family protein [Coriobacteriia bacterium]
MAMVRGSGVSESFEERSVRLRASYEAKARAELAAADALAPGADTVRWSGDPLASVVVVKGSPGPAEACGGPALSGADGEALHKALEALGWDPPLAFMTLSSPISGLDDGARAARLRLQVEAIDPRVVIALDAVAADDLARAFEIPSLKAGSPVVSDGRRIVVLSGFEASLGDERLKRTVWRELKAAAPDGPVF